jgi:signal transduction histidine kinase
VGALRQRQPNFSLAEALERLAKGVEDDQLVVDLHIDGDESGYARSTLMALYRAAQEGLTNIQKHARASHVRLEIELGQEEAVLRLRDDGCGFSPDFSEPETVGDEGGFGLRGLRERLELLRGRLDIHSVPEHGTELFVAAPRNPFGLSTEGKDGSQ